MLLRTMHILFLIFLLPQPEPQTTSQFKSRPFCDLSYMTSLFGLRSLFWKSCLELFSEEQWKRTIHPAFVLYLPNHLPSPHLRILTSLRIGYYCPHFTVEEAKAQRGKVMSPRALYWLLSYSLPPAVLLNSAKLGLRLCKPHFTWPIGFLWGLPTGGARGISEGSIGEKRQEPFYFACCSCKWPGLSSQPLRTLAAVLV